MAELEGKLNNSFFIPSCTPDHKYSRVQCHNTTGQWTLAAGRSMNE